MSYILFNGDGDQYHYNDEGYLHNLNGPAWITQKCMEWIVNGRSHRLDGPAVIYKNGHIEWWVNNERLSKEKEKLLNIWYESKKQ